MSDELKPCPFCGSAALTYQDAGWRWFVHCVNDACDVATTACRTTADAIAAWNRRAAPADEATSRLRGLLADGLSIVRHHVPYTSSDAWEDVRAFIMHADAALASTQPAAPTAAEEPWQDMLERGESLVREALKRAGEAR